MVALTRTWNTELSVYGWSGEKHKVVWLKDSNEVKKYIL